MKVSQEKTGDLTSLIKIEIQEADYQQEVEKQLRIQRKKMNIPGFRPGQVPFSMVKRMYETPVMAQEIENLMSQNLYKFIDDNKIKVLGSPMANDEKTPKADFQKDKDFTFYFDIAIEPEFDLDLKKVKSTIYEIEPQEEQIDKFVEDTCMRFGKVETPEQIGEKDMVYGHLVELQEDGSKKEGGIDTNTTMYVERIALATIKKQFIGKKKDATIRFKPSKALKDANFLASFIHKSKDDVKDFSSDCDFTVISIHRMTPAEKNADLFNKVYPNKDIKDEKQFRELAKQDLAKTYTRESDSFFLNQTSETLVKETKFDIPEEFLKRWLLATSKDKKSKEDIEDNFEKYLDGIRWQIIESKIASQFNISVKEEDVINYFKTELLPSYFPALPDETEEQAKEREEHLTEVAKNMLNEKDQTRQVYNYLFDRQMTKTLKENTKLTTKKVSMGDFIKEVSPNEEKKNIRKRVSAKVENKE